MNANNLKTVSFAEDSVLTSIGDLAFAVSGLESVDIPEGVTSIGEDAFARTNIKSVTIPDGVTSLKVLHISEREHLPSVP